MDMGTRHHRVTLGEEPVTWPMSRQLGLVIQLRWSPLSLPGQLSSVWLKGTGALSLRTTTLPLPLSQENKGPQQPDPVVRN